MRKEVERGEMEENDAQPSLLAQLQKALNKAMGNSQAQQSRFMLRAIQGISSQKVIINFIQSQIFKVTKTQANALLEPVRKYYEEMKKKPNMTMEIDCQAHHRLRQIIAQSFQNEMNENLDNLTEFNTDFIENIAMIEENISVCLDKLRDSLSKEAAIKQYTKNSIPDLKEKLRKQMIEIMKCFLTSKDLESDIEEVAQRTIDKQAIDCQEFYCSIKNSFREGVAVRVITVIQNLDSFIALKEYGERGFTMMQIEFAIQFYEKFYNVLPFKTLKEMLGEFLKDPLYYFTNRSDLSSDQIKALVQELWAKQSSLIEMIKSYKNSDTLAFKIRQEIQSILHYLIFNLKYNIVDRIPQIKQKLEAYELTKFLDETEFVSTNVKQVYEFIATNCRNYMRGCNQRKCSTMLRITSQMKLKAYLFQLFERVPYKAWAQIQGQIMKGNINIIERHVNDEQTVDDFRQWIEGNLQEYFESIMEEETIMERVKAQVIQYLVKKGWKGLSFEQINKLANQLLENPYLQIIQAARFLTDQNKRDIRNDFAAQLPQLNNYCRLRKIDISSIEKQARAKIQRQVNRLKPKLTYEIKQRVIESYLKCPKDSTIYEEEDISRKWKIAFLSTVKDIPQVQKYTQNFNVINCVEKRDAYLSKIKPLFKPFDYQTVKQYTCVFGEILFSSDGKVVTESRQLADAFKGISSDNFKKFKQAQSSNEFKDFMEELPTIAQYFKEECENRFMEIIKKNYSLDYSQQEQEELSQSIRNILEKDGANNLLNNQIFERSQNTDLKNIISQQSRFKRLLANMKMTEVNQKLFAELGLKKKIKEIYNHQSLMDIYAEQKRSMIGKITNAFELEEIKGFSNITDDQKQALLQFIKESQQYKKFIEFRGQAVKPKPNQMPQNKKQSKPKAEEKPQDNRNPQIKMQEKKQEVFEERFEEPLVIETKPAGLTVQMKNAILQKWENKLLTKEKSQYKNGKAKGFSENPLPVVEELLRAYPWTAAKLDFWKHGPKNPFLKELQAFAEGNKEELEKDTKELGFA